MTLPVAAVDTVTPPQYKTSRGRKRNLARPGQLLARGRMCKRTGLPEVEFYAGEGVAPELFEQFERWLSQPRVSILALLQGAEPWKGLLAGLHERQYDLASLRVSVQLRGTGPALPKRVRLISCRPGMLQARWARVEHDSPDLCTSWGLPALRRDSTMLMSHFSMEFYEQGEQRARSIAAGRSFIQWMRDSGLEIRSFRMGVKRHPDQAPGSTTDT
ncbi:hypothetical protein D3C71_25490 [compost metagenome]